MSPHRTLLLVLAVTAMMGGGCQRSTADGDVVAAKDARTFAHWRATAAERMKPDEQREFDAMLQEIRLRIMAESRGDRRGGDRSGALPADRRTNVARRDRCRL